MRYCKKCVQPDTRPGIHFDENGVCGACLYEQEKKSVDWKSREKELREIAKWAKKKKQGVYDCTIGVSGGKDSTVQALYARDKLGLRPLLVNTEPEGITEIGRSNWENLRRLGFDAITIRPNPALIRKLVKRDFYKYLNPVKITEFALNATPYIFARQFKIPLIIQGENPGLTLGVRKTTGVGGDALNANLMDTLANGVDEYLKHGATKEDLFFYHYDRQTMMKEGYKGVWLQYYLKDWSLFRNAKFSAKHGFRGRAENFDPNSIGTYVSWSQLDSDLIQVNQMLKWVKFGFGQCTDHACYGVREGNLSRKEAIELVRKYDGKCAPRYIKKFCDYIGISVKEFWRVTNSFRGKMWKKSKNGKWELIDPIWKQVRLIKR